MKILNLFVCACLLIICLQTTLFAAPNQEYQFENTTTDSMGNVDMIMPADSASQPTFQSGPYNSVLSFDGNDYLETSYTDIAFDQLTVSGLFYKSGTSTGTIFSMAYVADNHVSLPDETLDLRITSTGSFYAHARSDAGWQQNLVSSPGSIQNDQWYYFAFVYDMYAGSNGIMSVYIDGTLLASIDLTYQSSLLDIAYDSKQYIGTLNESPGTGEDTFLLYFEGQLDQIKVYHSALTSSEITAEYTSYPDYNNIPVAVPEPATLICFSAALLRLLKRRI